MGFPLRHHLLLVQLYWDIVNKQKLNIFSMYKLIPCHSYTMGMVTITKLVDTVTTKHSYRVDFILL